MATASYSTGISANVTPIPTSIMAEMLYPPTPTIIAGTLAVTRKFSPADGVAKMAVGVDQFPLLTPIDATATAGTSAISPTYFSVTITAVTYNQSVILPITTRISSQIPWMAVIIERQLVASKRTEDLIIAQALLSSVNTYSCQFGTNGQIPTEVNTNDAATIKSTLNNAAAPESAEVLPSSTSFNTYGLTDGYIMMTSTQGQTSFTTQIPSNFTQPGAMSYPSKRLPGEIGYFPCGIRVLTSQQWPLTGLITTSGYPILQGAVASLASYCRLIHPEMYHRLNIVGSAFLGINNLQEGCSINLWIGAGILQTTWCTTVLYSAAA